MVKPQVTITLGRSGQKVVKESMGDSYGICVNASRSKRSLVQFFGISADQSLIYNDKRMRGDMSERSYGYTIQNDDSRLDPKDLRLKLTHKRMSRHIELEIEKRKRVELHEVSRSIQSLESPERSLLRKIPSPRGAAVPPQMDLIRSSYSSRATNGARPRSTERVEKYSSGFSTLKGTIDELSHVPSIRPMDASRTGRVLMTDPLESSRLRVPLPTTSMAPMDSAKLVKELPPVSSGMFRVPHHPDNQPLTVSSLLHSLGLGKYAINFLAEEIDMVALKQMRDHDLKELGIPMGPRKKILLALQARTKRPTM